MAPGFEAFEAARCAPRPEVDAGNRHRVAGIVRQEHPVSACIAPPRFFRRCARPAWRRTWLLLCKPRNHSHCCTLQLHLLLLASAASEARGEGATHHRPPGASAEAPPPASAPTPRPSPAASCSLPPVSASCPHCPRLQQHLVNFPKFNLMLVVKWLLCTLTVQKRFSASAMVESAWRQRWLLPSVDLYLNSDPPRWAGSEHTGQRNRIGEERRSGIEILRGFHP